MENKIVGLELLLDRDLSSSFNIDPLCQRFKQCSIVSGVSGVSHPELMNVWNRMEDLGRQVNRLSALQKSTGKR